MTLSTEDFELLLQANRILSSKLDTAEVLQTVMELATKVVRAEAASLLLLDEAAGELYVDVALGSARETVKRIRLKVGEGVAGWVAKERQPLIVNDAASDPRFTRRVDASTNFQTRSILAVPLLAKGRLLGVVEAINKERGGTFSEIDREAFEIFASQSAIAIDNARLFSEVVVEREKLNTIFDQMSEGLLLLDGSGRVRLANRAVSRFTDVPVRTSGDQTLGDLFAGFEAHPDLGLPATGAKTIDLVRSAGKDLYVSALLRRLASDTGAAEGFLVMLHDATEERRGERLKRNFLSLISHKLRTPLTVIVGYAPALLAKSENLTEGQKKAIAAIETQSEHLSGLVDKLLRFARAESDPPAVELSVQPVAPLIEEAIEASGLRENATVHVRVAPSLTSAPGARLDGRLAIEVFKNVLENAVKFNDKPAKDVAVSAEERGARVIIRIDDNGVGIPPEERENVFKKFHQVENSFTGQVPGAGLGLALCRKSMDAMGGDIWLDSEIGRGTSVFVAFPREEGKP